MNTYARKIIAEKTFDEERALYNLCDASVENCVFAGPADGFGDVIFDSSLYPCKGKVIKR